MKILVTGGAGYIGSILVPELLHRGHLVTVLDNFMYNQTPLLDYCMSSNLTIVRGDVTNSNIVSILYSKGFDLVIPLACLTGAPLCEYNPTTAYNVIRTSICWLKDYLPETTKVIYPTTNSGYGIGSTEMCTEESELKPLSGYGQWKCEAENIIMKRGNAVSLRLATAFGVSPRMRMDLLVNDLVYRAVTDRVIPVFEGHFRRNFIHVRDIAAAICHTIVKWDTMKNQVYNVGLSTANITKLDLAKLIASMTGAEVLEISGREDPDKRDYLVSNAKLEATGWRPVLDLQDGINELQKAYQIIKRNQHANI